MYDHPKQDAKPTLVIAGNEREYEDYLAEHKLTRTNAVCISNYKQLARELYPMDCPLATTGNFWVNTAYDSQMYRERKQFLEQFSNTGQPRGDEMRFGGPQPKTNEDFLREALQEISISQTTNPDDLRAIADKALKG
jgi:hypothetical protein